MKRIVFFLALLASIGCSTQDEANDFPLLEENGFSLVEKLTNDALLSAKRPQPVIWADCQKYSGIVVPATFKPESDPFDELYTMPDATFKYGVPLISDSKPGDKDYNGGRWHLNILKDGVDPSKYADACKEEDLDLADFDSTANYFGCPLTRLK
jgi:hypothetical protein